MEVKNELSVMNIDELLKDFGLDRGLMIQKNPAYAADFEKLDGYYKRYQEQPTEGVARAVNGIVLGFMENLKKDNPELFDIKTNVISEEELIDDTFSNQKKDLLFFIQQGNQDAIDDLFNAVGPEKTKRLLSYDNYKTYLTGLKTRNSLIIGYLTDWMVKLDLFASSVIARDGAILNQLFSNGDQELLRKGLDSLKENPNEAGNTLKKINALEQAVETGDADLTALVESLYATYAVTKKIKEKATKVVKEDSDLKTLIGNVNSGVLTLDVPLVSRLEKKTAIRVLTSAEDIAAGKPYRFITQTPFNSFFTGKSIYSDPQLTVFEAEPNDFEKQFGTSIYELGFAWFNIKNMLSIDDVLGIMYIGNISTSLMVDRDNTKLRDEYKLKLKEIFNNPESNKIGGRFFQFTQSSLKSLQRSGFLDVDFCPTRLLYAAMVLHAFPFPAFSHPYEFVNITTFSSLFQFQVLKGEFGNESFYTDGDILYHNFAPGANPPQSTAALVDLSRTTILNLKSQGRADVVKKESVINNFIPFLYTIPKTGLSIPTFTVKALDVSNRKINWGVYEFTADGEPVYVNSVGIDNFLVGIKNNNPEIFTYKGHLSEQLFSNPKDGVIIHFEKKYVAARGINRISLLSENFGKNWENYYYEMFTKEHLQTQILDLMKPEFVKSLSLISETRVESVTPNLSFKNIKKLEKPIEFTKAAKQEPVNKTPIKDNRVYINKQYSRDKLDKSLWPIYDKVEKLTGEKRDEAILDEMYSQNIEKIFPDQLVLLGFDLAQYSITKNRVVFHNKYKLTIPNLLSWTYYLEKV